MTEASHATDSVVVRELRSVDESAWTEFVNRRDEANLYHTPIWRDVIVEVFGHRPAYLVAMRGTEVRGILPMFVIKFPWLPSAFGTKLISLPYDVGSGGALAVDDTSYQALVRHAIALGRELDVDYLELRCRDERRHLDSLGLVHTAPVLISEMRLDGETSVWAGIAEDHRKAIRKAANRGVTVREATSLADFEEFDRIYLRIFRDFGTPPYGGNYFPALWRMLQPSGAVRLLLAFVGTRCVGGLLLFRWEKHLISKFAACLPDAVASRAYAALYWRAIQLGLELGCTSLNWGSSSRDQVGLLEFKERWGAQTRPAAFYALPIRRGIPPIERYYDSAGWTRRLWRQIPVGATRLGGGILNRWFC